MGLADRHYYRDIDYGRRRVSPWRMLSVNTWLIIICTGVFVVDQFAPPRLWTPVPVLSDAAIAVQLQMGSAHLGTVPVEDESLDLRIGKVSFKRVIVDQSKRPATPVANAVGEPSLILYQYMPPLTRWLHFSTFTAIKGVEFWRLIGFQFLHANLTHLLFNMLGLFFFGPIVEQYLGSKRYLAFYLLCGIFGALMFLFLNLLGITAGLFLHEGVRIPGLLFTSPFTPLVGASAGIFGVLMAGAFLAPRAEVLLMFFIPMQLRTLAYLLVAVAFFSILFGGHNAGGEAGHLGGALAGFYFIRRPHHLHGFFDFLGRVDPTSHHYRKQNPRGRSSSSSTPARTDEIDRILDKISRQGLHSLTENEKRILRDASGGARES